MATKKTTKKDASPSATQERQYAIVRVCGKQFRVTPGQKLVVDRVSGDPGSKIDLGEVLVVGTTGGSDAASNGAILGSPLLSGALVRAKVVRHLRGRKINIYKKKRRTGYEKSQGHRQERTELSIDEIVARGA